MNCRYCHDTGLCDYRPDAGTYSAIADTARGGHVCRECDAAPRDVDFGTAFAIVSVRDSGGHRVLAIAPTRDAADAVEGALAFSAESGEMIAVVPCSPRGLAAEFVLDERKLEAAIRMGVGS